MMIFATTASQLQRLVVFFFFYVALLCASLQRVNGFTLSTNKPPRSHSPLTTKPRRSTQLYNIFDAVGGILSGPKLEKEDKLPYHPPFCSELSVCNDGVRTFAIKERP
jgi:hypothetical protein